MRYRLFFLLIICAFLPIRAIAVPGELHSSSAMEIQAAFLVKFSAYVKWPESAFSSPGDPIIIGIVGRDPFGSTVDKIARSFKAKGRNVEIRRFTNSADITKSHVLFIPSSQQGNINKVQAALAGNPVLLVGNSPGFLEQSGSINFVMVGKKIRFDISRTNCQKAGLTISSKLLAVAHGIK
jgi:hypothetical protein